MKQFIVCFLMVLMGLSCKNEEPKGITVVDKAFLKREVIGKNVQLIDVRTPEEFNSGHIDDAINLNIIDSDSFLKQMESLKKDEPVYLYCKMGGRSNRAAQLLKENGFTDIYDYSGGYNDWVLD